MRQMGDLFTTRTALKPSSQVLSRALTVTPDLEEHRHLLR